MRKPKAYVAVILFLLLFLQGVRAAIQFDPFVGYEGNIHEAGWFPVTCEVFNDGPSFNAVIEIAQTGFGGGDQVRQAPVELPTNTRKRVVVPMFASSYRFSNPSWEIQLKDASGKQVVKPQTISAKTIAWESTIMAAIPRTFGGSPTFPKIRLQGRPELQPEVARITIDQFPDNPIALEGLNAIYLNSEKALDLKVNQVIALLGWVRSGGHLIVAVEQAGDVNSTPWLKQFVPMEVVDTTNIKIDQELAGWVKNEPSNAAADIDSVSRINRQRRRNNAPQGSAYSNVPTETVFKDADLPIATGQLKDGFALVSSQSYPLVVQAPRGRGKITLLTFSPEREPFRSWKTRDLFWGKLCGIPGEFFNSETLNYYGGASVDGVFGALIDSRQIKKLPVTWLLLLLVVYLVVIGPFDQWWLKKIGKQMLTWITFPSYVVLFSLLIYFIGYKLRAGETEWNELNIVDVLPRGDKVDLRGRTYVSIYSSGNTRYSLTGQQGYATLRGELLDLNSGGKDPTKARLVQQGNTFKAEVEGLVWTSSLYANDWFKTNDTPFLASVSDSGTDYQVEIENLLNKPLTDVHLVANQMIFDIENLGPKQKKTFHLNPSKGTSLRSFVQQNGAYFQNAVQSRRNALGDSAQGQLENRPLTATTISFISQLDELSHSQRSFIAPTGLDLTPQVERGDAVIFAFVSDFSFTEKINQFDPPRYKRDTLIRLSIPLRQKT